MVGHLSLFIRPYPSHIEKEEPEEKWNEEEEEGEGGSPSFMSIWLLALLFFSVSSAAC